MANQSKKIHIDQMLLQQFVHVYSPKEQYMKFGEIVHKWPIQL